jgi:hypothetical protein
MRGIVGCRVLVLVFTAHANDLEQVGREVAKAFPMGLAVIPFRVEDVAPRENLGYFLEPYWEPLRKDPGYEKLLAELAPKDWRNRGYEHTDFNTTQGRET